MRKSKQSSDNLFYARQNKLFEERCEEVEREYTGQGCPSKIKKELKHLFAKIKSPHQKFF